MYQIGIDKKIAVLDEMNAIESKYLEKQNIEEVDREHINHNHISGNEDIVGKKIKRNKEILTENINSRSYKRVNKVDAHRRARKYTNYNSHNYCNKKSPLTKWYIKGVVLNDERSIWQEIMTQFMKEVLFRRQHKRH